LGQIIFLPWLERPTRKMWGKKSLPQKSFAEKNSHHWTVYFCTQIAYSFLVFERYKNTLLFKKNEKIVPSSANFVKVIFFSLIF
jgi:hypothetical protein